MKKQIFWFQTILLVLHFFQLLAEIPFQYFFPISIILFTSTYLLEKLRPYTPLFVVLIIFNTFRQISFQNIFILKIIETIIIVIIGILMLFIRVFHITHRFKLYQRLVKQKKTKIGFKNRILDNLMISISYPTLQKTGKKAKWLPHNNYYKSIHKSLNMDPRKKQFLSQKIIKYGTEFMHLYKLPVQKDSKILQKQKFKVILFSHGLAAHLNSYSTFTNWWASRGYIVITIQHEYDQIILNFTHLKQQKQIHQFLYQGRNASLQIRKQQFKKVFKLIEQGFLKQIFQKDMYIQQIILAGHSFGGTTILEAGAELMDSKLYQKVQGYICLDPWLFPLSKKTYKNLQKRIFFINSETFVGQNPEFYQLHQKNTYFCELNPQMAKVKIKNMDHLHQSDMIYVFGTILKHLGIIKNFEKSLFYLELNILLIYLFETGMKCQNILQTANNQINKALNTHGNNHIVRDDRINWKD